MIAAVVLCLGACLTFAAVAPAAGRRLPPAAATRLLAAGSALAAACGGFALAVMALFWFGQLGEIARWGHWSPVELRAASPLPAPVAITAGVVLLPLVFLGFATAVRRCVALVRVHRLCRHLARPGEVGVLDSVVPDAFTTAGVVGRIVVTTGLLRALDDDHRRALLAHEQSHLRHRHVWWRLAADLAAAVNPLLRPTARIVAQATERWADEDAAAVVGDRRLVARAIASAALATRHHRQRVPAVSGAADGQVPQRVRALLAPPPRRRPAMLVLMLVLLTASAVGAGAVERASDHVFDRAGTSAQHVVSPDRPHRGVTVRPVA